MADIRTHDWRPTDDEATRVLKARAARIDAAARALGVTREYAAGLIAEADARTRAEAERKARAEARRLIRDSRTAR